MSFSLLEIGQKSLEEFSEEIRYSNIVSLVVSFAAFTIFLALLQGYGWITPVYIALGMVAFINFTLLLNYVGFTLASRFFLSILPPIAILAGDVLTLINIPNGTHAYSFDVRVLILSLVVLPMLLFTMRERVYLAISLVSNAIILFFFDYIHTLFGVHLSNAFGAQYYISTIFYVIAFSFITTTLLILKVRWCKLNKVNKKILLKLEEKVAERTIELEKHAEELVMHNNELEQFSFNVSHNLRAPVARLLGLTTLFKTPTNDNTEESTIISHIQTETKLLDTVIKDLNNILQIRKNLYKIKEYTNISEEIETAQKLLSHGGQEMCCLKNMELNIEESNVFGVREYIQSITYNIMGNAFKYKREGVDLKLKISTELKDQNVILKFADNGRGIDLDKFGDKIFKMYSRFDLETQGKGIGLYLVKQQVESMNGTISIESKLGKGTAFSIALPLPNSAQIQHQVYFENDIVSFVYNSMLKSSLIIWKREPSSSEYRDSFNRNIKNLSKYATNFWIQDTSNFGILSKDDQEWFNSNIIPLLLNSGLKGIIIIHKEGKGFKSPHWKAFANTCSTKEIELAFKFTLEEANAFISSFSKLNQTTET